MTATKTDLIGWFDEGVRQGATHMIVVCDTYDGDNFPVYVTSDEDVREVAKSHGDPAKMVKVEEVYCLSMDRDAQMAEWRAFHY